jgi:hypothetical protein
MSQKMEFFWTASETGGPKYSEGVIWCQKHRWGVASLAIEKSEVIEKPYHIALSTDLASGDYWLQ